MEWIKKFFWRILWIVIRVVVDFAVFWGIFLWKDGVVWKSLTFPGTNGEGSWLERFWAMLGGLLSWLWSWIWMLLQKLWFLLLFLAPYGRMAAVDPDFRYCLHWCSGCVVIFAILSVWFCLDECMADLLPSILVTIASSFALWYAGFGASFLLVKIPVWFPFLAPVGMVTVCALAGLLLLGIESSILE